MVGFLRRNFSWLILAAGTVGLPFLSLSDQEIRWIQMAGPYDQADLTLTIAESTDPVFRGATPGNLTHVVSLKNNGPSTATGIGVTYTVNTPATGVVIDSVTPSSGSIAGPTWSVSSLGVGSTVTLTVVMSVTDGAPSAESITTSATVTSLVESDPDSSDNSAAETTEIARIIRVDCNASLAPDGSTWLKAYSSLVAALEAAEWGDELWVARCVYFADNWAYVNNDVHATFELPSGVKVFGGFNATESERNQRNPAVNRSILSGDIDGNDAVDSLGITRSWTALAGSNAYHLVTATGADSDSELDGFTLTGGWAAGGGVDDDGAVISCGGSDPVLGHLTIIGNRSDYRANLDRCSSTIRESAIISNYAGYEAAGLAVNAGTLTMVNCLVQGNQAAGAGALQVQNATINLTNVVVSGNLSGGGAMRFTGAVGGSLINVTVAGNRDLGPGGALTNASIATINISNSVFWNNQNANGAGSLVASVDDDGNGPTLVRYSLIQGTGGSSAWTGGTLLDYGFNLDEDPRFVAPRAPSSSPTRYGDYHLAAGSVALDTGYNLATSAVTDPDGEARIQGGAIDRGAYEGVGPNVIFTDGFETGNTGGWSAAARR